MRYSKNLERATRRPASTKTWTDEQFREARELDLSERTTSSRSVVIAALLSLALAGSLTTAKLVEIAERQPLGAWRDRQLTVAEGADRAANFLSLNRPYDFIQTIRGTGESAGQTVDTIDAVVASTTTTRRPPPSTTTAAAVPDATTTTTTTTSPYPIRVATDADPLRLLAAGDSQLEFLGQALSTEGSSRPLAVDVKFRISTGLARPDYFNWPAELLSIIEASDPEAVLLFMGANDHQDMADSDGNRIVRDTPEWEAEWSHRLEITFDLLEADNRHVFWVTQPPMRDSGLDEAMEVLNSLSAPLIESREFVTSIDIWEMFGGDDGFSIRVDSPVGTSTKARVSDGVHLSRSASSWVADLVFNRLDEIWDLSS